MENKICCYMDRVGDLINGKYVHPITCEIDPSNRCCLDCNFCMYNEYRSKENVDLDINIYKKLLKNLKSMDVKSITLTGGGEPLMHPKINYMIDIAFIYEFELGLVTNGVLLDTVDNPEYFRFIRVSLDAGSPTTYKKIKDKDLFDKVVNNVKDLVAKKVTDVGLSYVICDDNKDDIANAKKLAKELKVDYIQFKPVWVDNESIKQLDDDDSEKVIITNRYISKSLLPCKIAGLIGIVSANGKVYFCCQYRGDKRFEVGDLANHSFKEIWKNRNRFYDTINLAECPQCRYSNYSAGYEKYSKSKYKFLQHKNFL